MKHPTEHAVVAREPQETPGRGAEPREGVAGATGALVVVLPLPKPWLTINMRHKLHWRELAAEVRGQRGGAYWQTRGQLPPDFTPLVGRVRLDVEVHPYPKQKAPDDGGKWEGVKTLIDGLQDAGVFAGGDDKVVVHGAFTWHKDRRVGEVVLTLTQEEG